MYKVLSVFISLFFLCICAQAQTGTVRGCSDDANNDVYTVLGPTGYAYTNYTGTPQVYNPSSTSCPRFTSYVNLNQRCCINGNCPSTSRLYDFTVLYCPIDNYVIIALILISFFGFFYLKKRSMSLNIFS